MGRTFLLDAVKYLVRHPSRICLEFEAVGGHDISREAKSWIGLLLSFFGERLYNKAMKVYLFLDRIKK